MLKAIRFMLCMLIITVAASLLIGSTAYGANHVRLDSIKVNEYENADTVSFGIRLETDVQIQALILPLMARTVEGGLFLSGVDTLPWSSRLAGDTLSFIRLLNTDLIDGVSPDQFLIVAIRGTDPPLASGADPEAGPSITLRVALNGVVGRMEIDTALFPPNNPLTYVAEGVATKIYPEFTKGTIELEACSCPSQGDVAPLATSGDGVVNVLDVIALIDEVFRSGPETIQDPTCSNRRGDIAPVDTGVQCGDGVINVLDVVFAIDHVFRSGAAPCDGCNP